MNIETRLRELGITLPEAAKSLASYVPFVIEGEMLFISGQLPMQDGKLLASGQCGDQIDLAQGQQLARQCAINILAQLKEACQGDWSQVGRCVKLTVFVSVANDFAEIAQVANGASELIATVLGERGQHSRSAVGVAMLPLHAPVEVEAIFSLQ